MHLFFISIRVACKNESVPVSEKLLKRDRQGGILSHLQNQTPAVIRGHRGVSAIRQLKRKLLQKVHLICWNTEQGKKAEALRKLVSIQTSYGCLCTCAGNTVLYQSGVLVLM